MKLTRALILFGLTFTLTACDLVDLQSWQGGYGGMWVGHVADGSISKKQIAAKLEFNSDAGSAVVTTDLGTITVTSGRRGRIYLESSIGDLDGSVLVDDGEGCYAGSTGEGHSLSICPDENHKAVDIEELDGYGNSVFFAHFENGLHPLSARSADFTIDDAVKIAKTQSYSSRIEYEVILQSRLQSKQAHLDLIPHLSLNSVVALVTPINIVGLLTAASDLVPFLFPDRWARARQAGFLAKAQKQASQLTQIDTISQLEELAIMQWSNDRQSSAIAQLGEKLDAYTEQIQVLEKFGTIANGTSEGLKIISIAMKKDLLNYDETRRSSVRNLNVALGFDQMNGISSVSIAPILLDYSSLKTYDVAATEKLVLDRSKNLTQLDALIQAAHQEKKASVWSWLNPSVGIGAGMFTGMSVAKSKVREFELRKSSTILQLKGQIRDMIGQWEMAKQTYKLCFADLDQQRRRLEKTQVAYKFGKDVSALDIVNAVQETNKSELSVVNVETALQIIDSRLRKLTLGKNYDQLNE